MNEIRAKDNAVEIVIFEPIEAGFARRIRDQLEGAKPSEIRLHINSPGGVVSEAIAAYGVITRHPAKVNVHIDGVAASAASFLAMAGNTVTMAESALLMIHNPWVGTQGDAKTLRETADVLDKHRDILLKAYGRSGQSRDRLIQMLDAETWLDADEAKALGFVDEVLADRGIAASADLTQFNIPERLKPMTTQNYTVNDRALHAEARRRDDISAKFDMFREHDFGDLKAQCLADRSITADEASEKILAKLGEGVEPLQKPRAFDPLMDGDAHHNDFFSAATDAILMKHGVPMDNYHPGARDVAAMSVVDMSRTLLSQRGRSIRSSSGTEIIKAAMSTSDLPALLENVANKGLMQGFRESEAATHRIWTRESTLADFKTASRVALSEAPSLQQVPELAEYTSGSLSDAKEQIKLDTYGRIVTISRQSLVNDDLGELARLPVAMGQAAARKEADLVYSILTDNPTMRDTKALFHVDHGNIGTSGALSVATLGEARKLMRMQKGLAGEATLNTSPRFLIVPAALETDAEQLLAQIAPSSTSNVVPDWVRDLTLVVDSRLDADSETAWYLAASPMQMDTVEIARLDGQGVSVETDEGFLVDQTNFKVRLDVGAAVLDWRGLVMNEGV